jgi:DNA-binding NarL/FixJ family response regulator
MKKTVVVVEDDLRLREHLIKIFEGVPDIECLYAVGSAEEAVEKIPLRPPDVVLMDIKLPGKSGIDCTSILKRRLPETDIVMLTAYEEDDNIFSALQAGAAGYLLKSSRPTEIFDAVRNAYAGGAPFTAHIARKVVHFFQRPRKSVAEEEKLSRRECEVLDLLATGYIYKEIADMMDIHLETVRTYVKRICMKMHVRGRVEAIIKYKS